MKYKFRILRLCCISFDKNIAGQQNDFIKIIVKMKAYSKNSFGYKSEQFTSYSKV